MRERAKRQTGDLRWVSPIEVRPTVKRDVVGSGPPTASGGKQGERSLS